MKKYQVNLGEFFFIIVSEFYNKKLIEKNSKGNAFYTIITYAFVSLNCSFRNLK